MRRSGASICEAQSVTNAGDQHSGSRVHGVADHRFSVYYEHLTVLVIFEQRPR
jgi:hypothetical protein